MSRMPIPHWYHADPEQARRARAACIVKGLQDSPLEEAAARSVRGLPVFRRNTAEDWEQLLQLARIEPSERYALPGWLFVRVEQRAQRKGQVEGLVCGLLLGGFAMFLWGTL